MKDTIIIEKQNKIEGGNVSRKRSKTKFYAKVEDNIYDLFDQKGVRTTYRMLYMALSGCLISNSEFSKVSFPDLRQKTGIVSDTTLTKGLKELCQKGFISKMENSTYRLWHGVFKGLRENQIQFYD